MTTQVPLRCECGQVRGVITDASPDNGTRLVCMCADCQAFARFLERPKLLDSHGGTDIYQITPAQLQLTEGTEQLCCMRLSPKGLLRWYAGCCNTPIGNTLASASVPFVGVIHAIMDHETHGQSRDRVLGTPRYYIHGRAAVGGLPAHAHPTASLGTIVRMFGQVGMSWLRGKQRPSAFFHADTGQPVVTPLVLTLEQRRALSPAS